MKLSVLLLALTAASSAAPALAQRPPAEDLVWPLAPETPRIRYVGQLQSELDVGRKVSFLTKIKSTLVGTQLDVTLIQRPHDVHVEDGGKRFYVSDGGRGKILVYDTRLQQVQTLGEGGGQGALKKPMGLGGDGRGTVYVADPSADRVVAFDRDGKYLRAYGGESVLHNPVDAAVDPERGRLYVVDSYLHQVVIFSLEDGSVLGRIGKSEEELEVKRARLPQGWSGGAVHGGPKEEKPEEAGAEAGAEIPGHAPGTVSEPRDIVANRGSGDGEFRYPAFVAVGPQGNVYVTDQMNFRVQAFDPEGTFIRTFGGLGDKPGGFARPKGVAVDSEGHVYVADGAFGNLQIFDPNGQLLMAFGGMGEEAGQLWLPLGISIDAQDQIYVADRFNNRIQVYKYLPEVGQVANASGGN